MPSPRIVFPFVGDSVGGAQISTILLSKELKLRGFDPVFVIHEQGPLTTYLRQNGLDWLDLGLSTYVGRHTSKYSIVSSFLETAPKIARWLAHHDVDLVHAHDSRMNLTWCIPSRLTGTPFIWHQRSKFAGSGLMRLVSRAANQIVSISQYTLQTQPAHSISKSKIVYNPFETKVPAQNRQQSKNRLEEELKLDPNTKIIGFVGNLTVQKRPDVFIDAAKLIAESSAGNICFVIIGSDRQDQRKHLIERLKTMAPTPVVYFLGHRTPIQPLLAALDLLIAPAVDEAFGRVLVEAMLEGTPVVAAASGGHTEIIKDGQTGRLVEQDNPQETAEVASNLLADQARTTAYTEAANLDVKERFSSARHADELAKIYCKQLRIDA